VTPALVCAACGKPVEATFDDEWQHTTTDDALACREWPVLPARSAAYVNSRAGKGPTMDQYDQQTDRDLEERFQDLYVQIMGAFDSLPLATWTPEYRAARREIQTWEIEFRTIGTELARRLNERAARRNETMDAALQGIIDQAASDE
jgi:hypothetical protein